MKLTIIADPDTGAVFHSLASCEDGLTAYRFMGGINFAPISQRVRDLSTPDGCTVGENAAYLSPGEWICWDGPLTVCGGGEV